MLQRLRQLLVRYGKVPAYLLLPSLLTALWAYYPVRPRFQLDPCYAAIFSADGRTLATAAADRVTLWELPSGRPRHTVPMHWSSSLNVKLLVSSDGSHVVLSDHGFSGVSDPRTYLWQPGQREGLLQVGAADDALYLSDDFLVTKRLATLTIWSLPAGEPLHVFADDAGGPFDFVASDGRWLVLRAGQHAVLVWDLVQNGPLLRIHPEPFDGPLGWYTAPLLGDKIRRLATVKPGKIAIWDLATARELNAIAWHPQDWGQGIAVEPIAFSPDGSRLLVRVVGYDAWMPERRRLDCWDLTTTPPRKIGSLQQPLFTGGDWGFSPDGKWVLDVSVAQGGFLLSSADLRPLTALAQTSNPNVIEDWYPWSIAPDSRTMVSGLPRPPGYLADTIHAWLGTKPTTGQAMRMWDTSSGRELLICPDCNNAVYSPDGTLLVTWGDEGPVQVWDVPPRRPVLIEYGVPVLLVALLLWGYRCWCRSRSAVAPAC